MANILIKLVDKNDYFFDIKKKKNERMKETSIDVSMYKKNRALFIELRICILYCTIEFLLLKRKKQKKRNG